jgi:hypothetical protein
MPHLTDLECMILGHLNLAEFNREIARWSGVARCTRWTA